MNSQLSSCIVHVWLSIGKFFRSMGQESVSVSLENRDSSTIMALDWCVKWKGDALTHHTNWIASYPTVLHPQHQPSPDVTQTFFACSPHIKGHIKQLLSSCTSVSAAAAHTNCAKDWQVLTDNVSAFMEGLSVNDFRTRQAIFKNRRVIVHLTKHQNMQSKRIFHSSKALLFVTAKCFTAYFKPPLLQQGRR